MPYKVDGKDYMSIGETAIRWNKSATFVKTRLDAGLIPFATTKAKHGTADPIKVIPIDFPCPDYDPEKKVHIRPKHRVAVEHPVAPENGFPALHRNAEGAVAPAKIDKTAEEVSCADCPHQVDKTHKCYGLARYDNGETGEGFYGCHRIGRKVHPLKEWTRKSDYQPTPTGVEERKNEVPVIHIEKPVPVYEKADIEHKEPVLVNAMPEIVNVEEPKVHIPEPTPSLDEELGAIKAALIELDILAEALKEECEELGAKFDDVTARLDSIIKAREALKKVVEMEVGKSA